MTIGTNIDDAMETVDKALKKSINEIENAANEAKHRLKELFTGCDKEKSDKSN